MTFREQLELENFLKKTWKWNKGGKSEKIRFTK